MYSFDGQNIGPMRFHCGRGNPIQCCRNTKDKTFRILPLIMSHLLRTRCKATDANVHWHERAYAFLNRKKGTEVQFTEAVMQMTKQQCFCGGKLAVNSPVKRRRVTLCLTAENHLPVLLHGVYWKHNAAWLLREHGALQHVAYRQTEREREGEKESDQHAPLTDTHPACKTSY